MASRLEETYDKLVSIMVSMGFPERFGQLIAGSLGTEKTMDRMIRYLYASRPRSMEEVADEMLAIKAQFEGFRQKKINEYYNGKINRLLNEGLGEDDEESL